MTKKYYVYNTLNHDGKEYRRGAQVELSDEAASTLFQLGTIGNDKVEPEPVEAPVAAPETAPEPKVGGEAAQTTGEPSMDAPAAESASTEAVDVTPKVSERMTREELEAAGKAEGITQADMGAAKTKADLVDLITAKHDLNQQPAADPSANL